MEVVVGGHTDLEGAGSTVVGSLHRNVKGRPADLQYWTPPPGGRAIGGALLTRAFQEESETPSIQKTGAVKLNSPLRLVVGDVPGQQGGVTSCVNQRYGEVVAGAIAVCVVIHKHASVAQGNVDRGPQLESSHC